MEVLVEEYMTPGLSEEAIRRAMESSELIELAQWEGLAVQLNAMAHGDGDAVAPATACACTASSGAKRATNDPIFIPLGHAGGHQPHRPG
jgi:hypothetical protein